MPDKKEYQTTRHNEPPIDPDISRWLNEGGHCADTCDDPPPRYGDPQLGGPMEERRQEK